MLTIPDNGFTRSVNVSRMKTEIVSDWVEETVLFGQEELSTTDVSDVLMENDLCANETVAEEIVNNAWNELGRRIRWTNRTYSIEIDGRFVRPIKEWEESIAHVFCLLLSLAPNYSWWTSEFGRSYVDQGELFEMVTKASLEAQLDEKWTVIQTGWTRSNPQGLSAVVSQISNHLNENPRQMPSWVNTQSKELGLDLLCVRNFPDNRPGIPVYMLQCASGDDWTDKLFTPKLGRWKKIIDFYSHPIRGMAIPFCINDDDFMSSSLDVEGLFLDRCRILNAAASNPEWLSDELGGRLADWCRPRINQIVSRSR